MEPIAVVIGRVMPGKKVGRTLGVPTANLPYPPDVKRAPNGVYVATVRFLEEDRPDEEAVLSQGFHPTLPEGEPTVEVFLLNFREDLYGKLIEVRFLHFIRPELKFDSKEAMRVRMEEDIRFSHEWFSTHRADLKGGRMMLRDRAVTYYEQGMNCAEAMLLAISDEYQLGLTKEQTKLVSGFGGGMGCEDVCGALTGAVAAMGPLMEDKASLGAACSAWVKMFGKGLGDTNCKKLKDMHRDEQTKCKRTVALAADSFAAFMKEWRDRE